MGTAERKPQPDVEEEKSDSSSQQRPPQAASSFWGIPPPPRSPPPRATPAAERRRSDTDGHSTAVVVATARGPTRRVMADNVGLDVAHLVRSVGRPSPAAYAEGGVVAYCGRHSGVSYAKCSTVRVSIWLVRGDRKANPQAAKVVRDRLSRFAWIEGHRCEGVALLWTGGGRHCGPELLADEATGAILHGTTRQVLRCFDVGIIDDAQSPPSDSLVLEVTAAPGDKRHGRFHGSPIEIASALWRRSILETAAACDEGGRRDEVEPVWAFEPRVMDVTGHVSLPPLADQRAGSSLKTQTSTSVDVDAAGLLNVQEQSQGQASSHRTSVVRVSGGVFTQTVVGFENETTSAGGNDDTAHEKPQPPPQDVLLGLSPFERLAMRVIDPGGLTHQRQRLCRAGTSAAPAVGIRHPTDAVFLVLWAPPQDDPGRSDIASAGLKRAEATAGYEEEVENNNHKNNDDHQHRWVRAVERDVKLLRDGAPLLLPRTADVVSHAGGEEDVSSEPPTTTTSRRNGVSAIVNGESNAGETSEVQTRQIQPPPTEKGDMGPPTILPSFPSVVAHREQDRVTPRTRNHASSLHPAATTLCRHTHLTLAFAARYAPIALRGFILSFVRFHTSCDTLVLFVVPKHVPEWEEWQRLESMIAHSTEHGGFGRVTLVNVAERMRTRPWKRLELFRIVMFLEYLQSIRDDRLGVHGSLRPQHEEDGGERSGGGGLADGTGRGGGQHGGDAPAPLPRFVVITDSRDAVFMGNIFEALYERNVDGRSAHRRSPTVPPHSPVNDSSSAVVGTLFTVAEAMPLSRQGMNLMWLRRLIGANATAVLANRTLAGAPLPVICSGLYGGTFAAILDYLAVFNETMENRLLRSKRYTLRGGIVASANTIAGMDQPVHMALVLFGLAQRHFPHRVVLFHAPWWAPFRHAYVDAAVVVEEAAANRSRRNAQSAADKNETRRKKRRAPAATSPPAAVMLREPRSRLHLNCDGDTYRLIHQLDRQGDVWNTDVLEVYGR